MLTTSPRVIAATSLAAALLTAACAPAAAPASTPPHASIATDWIGLVDDLTEHQQLSPTAAARVFAWTAVALHDTEAALTGRTTIAPDPQLSRAAVDAAAIDRSAAATAAAAQMTSYLFPSNHSQEQIAALAHDQFTAVNAHAADADIGRQLGRHVVERARRDGYHRIGTWADWSPPNSEHAWRPTAPSYDRPTEPFWGNLVPISISRTACTVAPPLAHDLDPRAELATQAHEVLSLAGSATDDQKEAARFWDDAPEVSAGPAGHWLAIATAVAADDQLDYATATRLYAAAATALHDATILTWEAKYDHLIARPLDYITAHIDDTFTTYIPSPPFPEHPSGHASQSAAAATVLTALAGDRPFTDTVNDMTRSYDTFTDAADEAAMSRIWAGIHYRHAADAGSDLGRCVAGQILDRLHGNAAP